jgi:hypothetical protein
VMTSSDVTSTAATDMSPFIFILLLLWFALRLRRRWIGTRPGPPRRERRAR